MSISFKALLVVVFWGYSFVAVRTALHWLSPIGLVAARLAIGAVVLLAITRAIGGRIMPLAQDRVVCLLLGVTLAVHLTLQAIGLQWTTATNTSWIIAFTPVTIAVGTWLFLKQPLTLRAWTGTGVGALGVLLISAARGFRVTDATFGDLLQLSSCVTWTVYTLLAVKPIQRSGSLCVSLSTLMVSAGVMLILTTMLPVTRGSVTWAGVGSLLFLGIACSGLAYWLWYGAVQDVGTAGAGAYLYIEPFVTWVAAAIILGERMHAVGIVGGVMVLIGVWVVASARRRALPPADSTDRDRR